VFVNIIMFACVSLPYNLYCVGGDVKHCSLTHSRVWVRVFTARCYTERVLLWQSRLSVTLRHPRHNNNFLRFRRQAHVVLVIVMSLADHT